ncbi:MAG: sensor histidine kinase [Caldimonas sp.]
MSSTPPSPASPAAPPESGWQRFSDGAVRLFHDYGNWLVGITWMRFFVLSLLLLISAAILSKVPPFNLPIGGTEEVTTTSPVPPKPPTPPRTGKHEPIVKIEKQDSKGRDVTISIDKDGVRITPHSRAPAAAASAPASAASAAASDAAASSAGSTIALGDGGVEIKLPPGADSEAVREAVEEAKAAVVEAIRDSQRASEDAAAQEASASHEQTVTSIRRIRATRMGDSFPDIALLLIVASAILKISYKGTIQAEVKAAVATETAESEQLKRQVVEARMAAMQAQVEPHFLFNTLASIDHLIETDPPRASQMQKNLIALLRASMPSMRESQPSAHNLGREMAVIRPYLEILKVRMEDRLQTSIHVPDGLLSAEFPSMMIQSLVENAIKHGLEPKAEGGRLSVSAEIVHGKLAVTVADTGLGFGRAETAGTGVGLANIRERLKLLYGDRASMVVADNTPSGTVVTLTVPYQAQMREGATA